MGFSRFFAFLKWEFSGGFFELTLGTATSYVMPPGRRGIPIYDDPPQAISGNFCKKIIPLCMLINTMYFYACQQVL
jgi:hypothetical protein